MVQFQYVCCRYVECPDVHEWKQATKCSCGGERAELDCLPSCASRTDPKSWNGSVEYYLTEEYHKDLGPIVKTHTGGLWRLSEPGYLDCTNWIPVASLKEARAACEASFDTCPDCGEVLHEDEECYTDDPYTCYNCGSLLPSGEIRD